MVNKMCLLKKTSSFYQIYNEYFLMTCLIITNYPNKAM
jgi:hypothetical protein